MNEDDIARAFGRQIEAALFKAMMGPPREQRQTALRATSWGTLETVELDDDGRVIKPPLGCGCGRMAIMHRPSCPLALACT